MEKLDNDLSGVIKDSMDFLELITNKLIKAYPNLNYDSLIDSGEKYIIRILQKKDLKKKTLYKYLQNGIKWTLYDDIKRQNLFKKKIASYKYYLINSKEAITNYHPKINIRIKDDIKTIQLYLNNTFNEFEQKAFLMRYYHGYTLKQIAKKLRKSSSSIKRITSRMLCQVREKLNIRKEEI